MRTVWFYQRQAEQFRQIWGSPLRREAGTA
jgi:hypothetical protein